MQKYTDHIAIHFFLMILIPALLFAQANRIEFIPIETGQGVSNDYFNWILQDRKGFMWFGSIYNGLYRYDGYNFKVYKPEPENPNSISNVGIEVIYEHPADSGKVLWIGTRSGLNRFDREKEIFSHYFNTKDANSLSSNYILSICGDTLGNLWIGTHDKGLNKFDRKLNKFIHYTHDSENENSLIDDRIIIVYMDKSGILWVGTDGGGLDRFDPEKEVFTHFRHDPDDPNSLSNNHIWSICEDDAGNIWVGTVIGLNKLTEAERNGKPVKFVRYLHDPNDQNSIGGNFVKSLYQDKFGVLWIGLFGDGVDIYDTMSGTFRHYQGQTGDRVKCIHEDHTGNVLWFATDGGGLYKWYRQQQKIRHYQHDPVDPSSLSDNYAYAMCEDHNGSIWITTDAAGVNCFDRNGNTFKHFRHDPKDPTSLSHDILYSCYTDRSGILWFGTANGLSRYSYDKGNFKNYLPDPEGKNCLKHGWLGSIIDDPRPDENTLWMGSWSGGLYKFNKKEEIFFHYSANPQDSFSLSSNSIRYIYGENIQSQSHLWIGTEGGGLNKFDLSTERCVQYKHDPANPNSLSSDNVWVILRNRAGILWIGTSEGLNKYNDVSGSFVYYGKKDGLPDDCVYGILEDGHGNLWLSTLNGISRFNPGTKQFRNFTEQDGLQGNEFNPWSFMLSHSGEMYFGGNNGFNIFHPDSLQANTHIPRIVLTDFQLYHETVRPGQNTPLSKTISEIEEITLAYDENIISFEFSALDYSIPEKNRYAYRMEGVDRDWIYSDASRRFATYTQMDPGTYIFHVKGSNNDGIWNDEGTSVRITILPPWWRTKLAYAFYIITGIMVLAAAWRYQLQRIRNKHRQELEHLEMEKLKEVDRLKSNFFANISHEFRTPITLIEGPLKQLLSGDFKGNLKDQYQLMLKNTGRLLYLVNQLLDLSKLDSGKMKLQAQEIYLIPLLKGLIQAFSSLADYRKIQLDFRVTKERINIFLDVEKFEEIINNLLSNAFKFTPEGGQIIVDCRLRNEGLHPPKSPLDRGNGSVSPLEKGDKRGSIELKISNTGSGIPTDQLDKIFDRFYQVDDSKTRHYEGTGIGLSLTKELVELHHGKINVACSENSLDMLTTFIIQLPLGCAHLADDEIIDVPKVKKRKKKESPIAIRNIDTGSTNITDTSLPQLPRDKILIVEDHDDVRQYIRSILDGQYSILLAGDGSKGLKLAAEKQPDLIISDVMMPQMDGYEFCRKIKENVKTSHIPVILLTAKAGQEDRLEGLEIGADDYLTKPFEAQELLLRSRNLIEQRKKLRQRFAGDPYAPVNEITITSADEKLLSRLIEVVTQDLANPDLDITRLTKKVGVSHITLYRKLAALTGLTPVNFIRIIRLRRAKQLLENQFGNVSEVAFEVGFNSSNYFSRCFIKQFGTSPSTYLKQIRS
jgi:signal transduction histidine kinase/ligand-binding sensor domain-containing protein/DNA-binding response OmpR family regulator